MTRNCNLLFFLFLMLIGSTIPVVAMDDFVELDLSNQGIVDLSQVFIAEGVTTVRLDDNNFTDLSPLKLPRTVRTLTLTGNNLENINGLKLPARLEQISLTGNKLTDIGNFNWPVGLKNLGLGANQIDSFEKIGNLPDGLIQLELSLNQISAGTFNSPRNLKFLALNQNPIQKLTDISIINANKLELLEIAQNQITDISDISDFVVPDSLRQLTLSFDAPLDIKPIANATSLRGLSILNVIDLEEVVLPPNMEYFQTIGDFERIDNFTLNDKLRILDIRSSNVNELGPNFVLNSSLRKLNLPGPYIDLSGLKLNKGLRVLSIGGFESFNDISQLPRFPNSLRNLNLSASGLDNLEGLTLPRNLRALSLDDLSISDIPRNLFPRGSQLRKLSVDDTDISSNRQKELRRRIKTRALRAKVKFDDTFFLFFNRIFRLKFDF